MKLNRESRLLFPVQGVYQISSWLRPVLFLLGIFNISPREENLVDITVWHVEKIEK